jgi:hypothetical protein
MEHDKMFEIGTNNTSYYNDIKINLKQYVNGSVTNRNSTQDN